MKNRELASFRDPSGHVYKEKGIIFRKIFDTYQIHYDKLMNSGLYDALVQRNWMVKHEQVKEGWQDGYTIIKPAQLSLISYSYSWSFSMLKDAALLTLNIQKLALQHGMILKDASVYNIQFIGSSPIFIDTLSFENLEEGSPWKGYGQFCRHFLCPLSLMSFVDISLGKLLINHLDGVPLPLTAKLLPLRTKLNLGLYLHIHLHAKAQTKHQDKKSETGSKVTKKTIENIAENLSSTIANLKYLPKGTEWSAYYDKDVEDTYLKHKKETIRDFLVQIKPKKVLDLGANDGTFSHLAAEHAQEVYSFDIDPACVEQNYLVLKKSKNQKITPLIADAANPEPAIGWDNVERTRLWDRINPDAIMALALIHHLCISNNLPFEYLAEFFAKRCEYLIIEWVPKEDEKVQRLLQNREDIFHWYILPRFKQDFLKYFTIVQSKHISESRLLFLLKAINDANS